MGVSVLDENDWSPVWNEESYHGIVLETASTGDPVLEEEDTNDLHNNGADHGPAGFPNTKYRGNSLGDNYAKSFGGGLNETSPRHKLKRMKYGHHSWVNGRRSSLPSRQNDRKGKVASKWQPRPLTVTASDADAGPNGRLTYSMATNAAAADFFTIDPMTGEK